MLAISLRKHSLLVLILFLVAGQAFGAASTFRLGATINVPGEVSPGNIVFKGADDIVYLIDQRGVVLHTWVSPVVDTTPGYSRPLDNGNLLTTLSGAAVPTLVELDWDGNIAWMVENDSINRFHHDWSRLPNGNTLTLCDRKFIEPTISDQEITDDCILEIDPAGNVVWDWQTADHFDDFGFSQRIKDKISAHAGDWAHANSVSVLPPNPHADPRFRPGNLLVSYRFLDSVVIIDRDTGDIVWRTDGHTIGQHHATMLPMNMPGAGNILIFDNGEGGDYGDEDEVRNFSQILELDPVDLSAAWSYTSSMSGRPNWFFYSSFISSAQRLPNGNTFIDEGMFGRFFEVNAAGGIVSEYVVPFFSTNSSGVTSNQVYRAHKVSLGWGN